MPNKELRLKTQSVKLYIKMAAYTSALKFSMKFVNTNERNFSLFLSISFRQTNRKKHATSFLFFNSLTYRKNKFIAADRS